MLSFPLKSGLHSLFPKAFHKLLVCVLSSLYITGLCQASPKWVVLHSQAQKSGFNIWDIYENTLEVLSSFIP